MEKIKKVFEKINYQKILIIYIIIQPIIDLLTSMCVRYISSSLTIGIVLRTLFMIFTAMYAIIVTNKKEKKYLLIYYITLLLYFMIFMINIILTTGTTLIVTQVKSLMKSFYFPIMLVALIPILRKITIKKQYFIYSLLGYTAILGITNIFGVAFASYPNGSALGSNGLFYAANEIGTILCVLMSYLSIKLIKIQNIKEGFVCNIINLLTMILLIISVVTMGTKVPFIGFICLLVVTFMVCIINIFKRKNIKLTICKAVMIILIGISIVQFIEYTPVGKNLSVSISKITTIVAKNNTHIVAKNNTQNVTNTVKNVASKNKDTNTTEKVDDKKTDTVKNVIVSNRDILLSENKTIYLNSPILQKIIGIGYVNADLTEKKLVEIDYFDILFSNGILGSIIYFIPLIVAIIYIAIKLFKKIYLVFDDEVLLQLYGVGIALLVAAIAGHVLSAPAVSFYLAINIAQVTEMLNNKKREQDKKIEF